MAFGINSQLKMSVSIGDYEDFLKLDKFTSFIIIEDIGLSLPYWELRFDCVLPELLKYFNELQTITVQLGIDTNSLEPYSLVIKKPIVTPETSGCYKVILRGFIDIQEYLTNEHKAVYENSTSLQLAQNIAKNYGLKFSSNLSETKDKMTYYQPGESDYKFLFNAWLHSYCQTDDLIIPAITMNKELRYNSIKTMISNTNFDNMTTFVDYKANEREIQVNANSQTSSNTTLTNLFGNYMKDRYIYNINDGTFTHINIDNNKPMISSSKMNSSASSISKSSGFFVQSSNVHKNYYTQELVNIQKYASLQSCKQWISAVNTNINNVHCGDLVLYMTKKENSQSNDQTSGMYLVNRKVISVKDRDIHMNFLLSRENMNNSK